jgi:hypothetical protein
MSSGHRGKEKRERNLPIYRIEPGEIVPRGLEGKHVFSGKPTCDHCMETRENIFLGWARTLKPGTRLEVSDANGQMVLLRINPAGLRGLETNTPAMRVIDRETGVPIDEPPRAA